jgi:CRISPR/Cas system-associated exonuclease Cas4 (RecB family)
MNFPPIAERWLALKASRIKQYPQNNLRASGIGHECDRYHYHSIKDWREKALHDPILQSIFDEGGLHETDVIKQLMDLGFQVVEQQRSFQIDSPKITGHIDGIIRWDGHDFPFDVKSISGLDFDKIDSAEDLLYSKKEHQKAYIAQIQLYMLMTNNEYGCFILKNKQTGEIKPIWCQIDFVYCDNLLKRAERVYKALADNEPPKRVDNIDLCSKCSFAHICLPDLKATAISTIDDQELAATMERMDQLKPMVKEYEELEAQVDEIKNNVGAGDFICGDYLLKIKEMTRTSKVPITFEFQKTTFLQKKIVKIPSMVKPN